MTIELATMDITYNMAYTEEPRNAQSYSKIPRTPPPASGRFGFGKFGQAKFGSTAGYTDQPRPSNATNPPADDGYTMEPRPTP